MITAKHIREIWESDPKNVARHFTAILKDFGYSVTPDYAEDEIRRLYAGGSPKGGPSMFIDRWLKDGIA